MSLEVSFFPYALDKSLFCPIRLGFQPCETQNREPSQVCLNLRPTELGYKMKVVLSL